MTISRATIQRAREAGNPVIHGNRATFIWEGEETVCLMSDVNDWNETAKSFKRISSRLTGDADPPMWACTLTLPRDAYVEYAFYEPSTERKILDPLNKRTVNNGVGSRNNYFYMPETMPSPYHVRRADVKVGTLSRLKVETRWIRDDAEREIYFYRPSAKSPFPLLVVFDGQDYLQRVKLAVMVDNLIAEQRIQPVALAFLPSAGRWRNVEYSCSDATLLWLDQVILPLARKRLKLLDVREQPGAFGVLGASLGGTMALYTGVRMPEVFGKVLSQSGAFMIESRDFTVVDLVRHGQAAKQLDIWMDVGQLEELLEDNRNMRALLKKQGYQVAYREFSGAHNYTAWRDDLWRGLEHMFPYSEK